MATSSSSITCEIKIIGAKNIKTKHKGNLFVRCYLSLGSNNKRVQINTKEISSTQKDGYIFWDDSFSLECNGTRDSIQSLKVESVFFELRWRNNKTFLGNTSSSQLVATAEVGWKNVFDEPSMELQRWVFMSVNNGDKNKVLKIEDGVKPPALQIAMKIAEAPAVAAISMEEMRKRRRSERLRKLDDCICGCRLNGECCSCSCVDNELFLIGAMLDDF